MANENKKDFNAMLADNKDMPKIQIVTDPESIAKYEGNRMYFAQKLNFKERDILLFKKEEKIFAIM